MLSAIVAWSIRARRSVFVGLFLLIACGLQAARMLPIDAMPDSSTIQVAVLTTAPGLSPLEVERTVTMPIEVALNGTPGGVELRSVSRSGLSAVTVVFADGTDVWFARQLVLERLRGIELPASAAMPELAPVSTGLGEIFQFVVRSEQHSPMQLRTLLDWEIVPRLRSVPGVVEVNTMGGELKQFQVSVDRLRLEARGLSLHDVIDALEAANVTVGGGYVERNKEAFTVRGEGMLKDIKDIGKVVVRVPPGSAPVLVRHVADVNIGSALRYGVITQNGTGEAVTGVVMMLLGANSKQVVADVSKRVHEVERDLPAGVRIEVVYDRADFVSRTLRTVMTNLLEGVVVVSFVLILFLGSLRAAIAVVLGVPAAMSIALFGMHLFHVTGDLMSLGAIDFGFLVDGPIVIVEAVMAATAGRALVGAARARSYERMAKGVARPVAFAVAIIMLVYVPLLSLEGVEGKMFKPMALTMASALFGAFVYSAVFFPAVLTVLVPPAKGHGPRWIQWIVAHYERVVPFTLRHRRPILVSAIAALVVASWLFGKAGAEFIPRIFEGDAVVTVRRAPSISLDEARRLDIEAERVLQSFPEVITTIGQTGRAEVAIDPVGNDNTDMLTRLRPLSQWKTCHDFDELSERFKVAIENRVPGTYVSVSQPIEDRTNEIISGSRADVQIQLFGNSLEVLTDVAGRIGKVVRKVQGTGDVRVERILGSPTISAVAERDMLARYGVELRDAFDVVQAAREGVRVGNVFEQERRFDLRVLMPPAKPTAAALGDLFVRTVRGESIPLREVVELTEGEGPTAIRREDRRRAVRVDVNLRGRDLVSWVGDARARVAQDVRLPSGYDLTWGGQFENFQRAQARLMVVLPVVIAIIFGMLLWMFGNWRFALAVFALVPLSLTGGMVGLLLSRLSFSLPAAVGFIALGGIGVLNGVVVASEVRRRLDEGTPLDLAIGRGIAHVTRAVLTTAAVAALGFLPMAVATSAGAEVQRPLARVVVVGMLFGTLITLVVLPGILRMLLKGYAHFEDENEVANEGVYVPSLSLPPPTLRRSTTVLLILLAAALLMACGRATNDAPIEPPQAPRVEGNRIEFPESFAKRVGLQTEQVRSSSVIPALAVVGTVSFDPQHVARVGTRLRGLVRDVRHYEGDVVKTGDLLASIDSPELGEAQAAVVSFQAELVAARRNAIRELELAEAKLTTLKESDEAKALAEKYQALLDAAQQKVASLAGGASATKSNGIGVHHIVAPLDGTIVERHITKGQLVEGDHTAFLVANLDTLWVELAVFEKNLGLVRVGDEVELRPLGSNMQHLRGKVANVGQVLDGATHSAPVRVEVDNRTRHLRPGQAVDAVIRAGSAPDSAGPVIPPSCVTFVEGKPTVFILDSPTSVRIAPVELGATDGKELRVKQGIQVGEQVVTNGTFELKSELFR